MQDGHEKGVSTKHGVSVGAVEQVIPYGEKFLWGKISMVSPKKRCKLYKSPYFSVLNHKTTKILPHGNYSL